MPPITDDQKLSKLLTTEDTEDTEVCVLNAPQARLTIIMLFSVLSVSSVVNSF